jgi:predicted deacetylase
MAASYIFRLDDITPAMDWGRFWALLQLFKRHGIKPLLGVVPDNRDRNLNRGPAHADFWKILRTLSAADDIDIAQHGYQHILVHRPRASILGPAEGIRQEVSEFAGDTYNDQSFRIREGRLILEKNGLSTTYWMAPNHSYDQDTLYALRDNGFTALSDGIALFPYIKEGLVFVPQTSWKPRWMPVGVHTVCLHTNSITPRDIKKLRLFLRRPFNFTRFSQVANHSAGLIKDDFRRTSDNDPIRSTLNQTFSTLYRASWAVKKGLKNHRPPGPTHALPERALRSAPEPLRP